MKTSWISALALLLAPVVAQAQPAANVVVRNPVFSSAGYFFFAVIVGVILAVAFQLVLANLSLAAGLEMLSSAFDRKGRRERKASRKENPSVSEQARKVNAAFGIWAVVCTSVALFFASWLGAGISLTGSAFAGVVLGLTIWGLSYILILALELRAISSFVGLLAGAAGSVLRGGINAARSVIAKSPEDRIADAAVDAARKVRDEVFGDIHLRDLRAEIDHYVQELNESRDPRRLRKELATLLDDVELHAIVRSGDVLLDKDIEVSLEAKGLSREDAQKVAHGVQEALSQIRDEAGKTEKSTPEKVADAALRVAGMSAPEAQATREKVEHYLRETGLPELNPEGIKRDLETILHDPQAGKQALQQRIEQVDCNTLKTVLRQRTDMTPEQADKIGDTACQVLHSMSASTQEVRTHIAQKISDYLDKGRQTAGKVQRAGRGFMKTVREAGPESAPLLEKLRRLDHNTIKHALAEHTDLSEEQAEQIVSKVESARDAAVSKLDEVQSQVKQRVDAARAELLRDAEETRKFAASAAWWGLAVAVISGIAAAAGGLVGALV